jgi:hypothetical protein
VPSPTRYTTWLLRIAHGSVSGPTGIEALTMAINGTGDPGGYPLTDAISGGFTAIAEAIREGRSGE